MKADVDRCHPWMVEGPRLLPGLEMGVLAPRDVIWKKGNILCTYILTWTLKGDLKPLE